MIFYFVLDGIGFLALYIKPDMDLMSCSGARYYELICLSMFKPWKLLHVFMNMDSTEQLLPEVSTFTALET
jgi:hypothetical protein